MLAYIAAEMPSSQHVDHADTANPAEAVVPFTATAPAAAVTATRGKYGACTSATNPPHDYYDVDEKSKGMEGLPVSMSNKWATVHQRARQDMKQRGWTVAQLCCAAEIPYSPIACRYLCPSGRTMPISPHENTASNDLFVALCGLQTKLAKGDEPSKVELLMVQNDENFKQWAASEIEKAFPFNKDPIARVKKFNQFFKLEVLVPENNYDKNGKTLDARMAERIADLAKRLEQECTEKKLGWADYSTSKCSMLALRAVSTTQEARSIDEPLGPSPVSP